jgi:hypothetical protein
MDKSGANTQFLRFERNNLLFATLKKQVLCIA